MHDKHNPQEALDLIRDTRQQALGVMDKWPWWYDAGYAFACGVLVLGQGLPTVYGLLCTMLGIGVLALIVRAYREQAGVWVNGYGPKRARWAAIGLGVLLLGLMGASIWFGRIQDIVWVPVMNGLIAALLAVVGSRIWMRLYRKDVRSL